MTRYDFAPFAQDEFVESEHPREDGGEFARAAARKADRATSSEHHAEAMRQGELADRARDRQFRRGDTRNESAAQKAYVAAWEAHLRAAHHFARHGDPAEGAELSRRARAATAAAEAMKDE